MPFELVPPSICFLINEFNESLAYVHFIFVCGGHAFDFLKSYFEKYLLLLFG